MRYVPGLAPTSFYFLLLILLLFLAGVVYLDLRSRRGWGLALMALALLGVGAWLANIVLSLKSAPSTGDDLASALVLAVYFGIYLALTLITWISALVEAGVSRHWGWFSGLVAATLIPALVVLALVTLKLGAPVLIAIGSALYFGLILAPPLIMLAYGVTRIVRPTRPAAA